MKKPHLLSLDNRGIHHIFVPLVVVVLVGVMGTYYLVASHAASTNTGEVTSGFSGKCLDDWGNKTQNHNTIDIYNCNGTAAQQWQLNTNESLQLVNTSYCIGVNGVSPNKPLGPKPLVQLFWCRADPSIPISHQQWQATSSNELVNVRSGLCLTVPTSTPPNNGTVLELHTCASAPTNDQVWHLSTTTHNPTVSLSANPTTVNSGSKTTLTWSSTNATTCTASGAWTGSKATSGTATITLTATSSFTLTCSGSNNGSASATANVTVISSYPNPNGTHWHCQEYKSLYSWDCISGFGWLYGGIWAYVSDFYQHPHPSTDEVVNEAYFNQNGPNGMTDTDQWRHRLITVNDNTVQGLVEPFNWQVSANNTKPPAPTTCLVITGDQQGQKIACSALVQKSILDYWQQANVIPNQIAW